jgi:glyoxylase-like metal-dependent hydrolase (beta-lactamase superfamily II)
VERRLYLRQLKAGRDFATGDAVAGGMANFVYLIGDRDKGECLVVDPAWDVDGILAAAAGDAMRVTGALVTHYHPDHVGGAMFGHTVQGLARLLAVHPCPIHVHEAEAHGVKVVTSVSDGDLVKHTSGDRVKAGDVEVEWLHTPGHTPGSSCFRCGSALISGDTLFLQGCGRVDLPGGDSDEMWRTISQRLATLPGDLELYPGHDYGDQPHAPLSRVRRSNRLLQVPDLATWRAMR